MGRNEDDIMVFYISKRKCGQLKMNNDKRSSKAEKRKKEKTLGFSRGTLKS